MRSPRGSWTIAAAAMLVSCAAPAPQPAVAVAPEQQYPVPTCTGEVECGQMWTRAIQYIQMASGMKVLSANETMIQTYPAAGIGRMTGTVMRYPIASGVYEIRGALACRRHEDCSAQAARGLNLFNMSVAGPPLALPSHPTPPN